MTWSTRLYPWLGNLAVLGLLVWSLVSLGLTLLGQSLDEPAGRRTVGRVGLEDQPRLKPLSYYEAMAGRSIFGQPSGPAPAGLKDSAPDQTPIAADTDLRLKGTIIQSKGGYRAAIIEDLKSRQQDLYRVGARIGSAELLRVETDQVVLRQDGREVSLNISPAEQSEKSSDLPFSPAAATKGQAPPVREDTLARQTGPNQFVISREALGRRMGDLNYFLSSVNIQPYFVDGRAHGFRLASVRAGGPVHQLGLKAGDVVLTVNGVAVSNPEDLVNLYRQVQQLETVTVGLERQGSPQTMTYSLR